jgi:hypothetical protein
MGEIYDKIKALIIQQKERGMSKQDQKSGFMIFLDIVIDEVYDKKEKGN